MDHARFHQENKVRELIENAGCELIFLPKYYPDLNPIEHWWQKIKIALKKELPQYDFNLHKAIDAVFDYF
jgi:transposase